MLPSWCRDSVTVTRAPRVVANGRERRDWSSATSHVVGGCSLQQTDTDTSFDGAQRDASSSTARLICPYGSDIREGDRITIGGRTWVVAGFPPGDGLRSPYGGASNLTVTLKEWRG